VSAPGELIVLGRVAGAHALRGEVRVRFFGDGPGALLNAERVFLGTDDTRPQQAIAYDVLATGTGRAGEVRLRLRGIDDRNAAEALKGRFVFGELAMLPELGDDEFYWHELIGCSVATDTGDEVGVVREIWDSGRHDVLVVLGHDGRQILIPTAKEIMTGVDRAARRIVVHDIPGLIHPTPDRGGEK